MRPAKSIALASALMLAATLATGCEEAPPPEYEFGILLADLELELISDTVGVFPDRSVVFDPNNPFRDGVTVTGKFELLDDGPIAGFYGFATALANEPTGENQWYTANQLQLIHERRLADPNDLALVRQLAIQGYQQVLDTFTGAVTFDVTGRLSFDLMPTAIQGILDLGGEPQNGWRLATGPDGELVAVQSGVTE
ncbi:MAG: hypothetical protein AAGA48_25800 [Myxococcota bacterium]